MIEIIPAVCKCKDLSEEKLVNAVSVSWGSKGTLKWVLHSWLIVATGFLWCFYLLANWGIYKYKGEKKYRCNDCGVMMDKNNFRKTIT